MKRDENGIPQVKDSGFGFSAFFSILFHILIFVGIPYFAKYLVTEPEYDMPPTFELMSIPTTVDNQSVEVPTSEPQQVEPVEEPEPVTEPDVAEPVKDPAPEPKEAVSIKNPKTKDEPKKEEKKTDTKKGEPDKKDKPKVSKQQLASEMDNLFDGPPKKGGSTSNGSASEMSYEGEIVRRIEQNWTPTVKDQSLWVGIRYSVARNGSLISVEITHQSGNKLLDLQAKRAVEMAFPMAPIPSDIKTVPFVRAYKLDLRKN